MQSKGIWSWLLVGWSLVAGIAPSPANAEEALSFIAEVKGDAWVVRADGRREAATMGAQLFKGDVLQVDKGKVSLIDLSGRNTELEAGKTYQVEEEGKPSALMGRIMATLGEVANPAGEAGQPLVHGMARGLEAISGARPANTFLSQGDFLFSWDPAPEVETYEFVLESPAGEVLKRQQVKDVQLPASSLSLKAGQRYTWSVQTVGAMLTMKSEKSWVEVVSEKRASETRKTVGKIEKKYPQEAQALLKAAVFFEQGFSYEAECLLLDLQGQRALSPVEQQLLEHARARMESPEVQPGRPKR